MNDLFEKSQRVFREAEINVGLIQFGDLTAVGFEGTTVIGFLLMYADTQALLSNWRSDFAALIRESQFALKQSKAKAWNTYAVLLSEATATSAEQVLLRAVEEDLVGARKIAQAGVRDTESLRQALLPLLPIQNAPRLEAVDMAAEIRLRTTELSMRLVDAFFSQSSDAELAQLLEDEQ